MSPVIKYSLYKDSPELEATRLRSILLFNGKVKKSSRQDLLSKAVLSLIISPTVPSTREAILRELNLQFKLDFKPADLETQIKRLHKLGLIESIDEPFAVVDSEKGRNYFAELECNTESLFDEILDKASVFYKPSSIQVPDSIKNTIRKALSVYYGMNGYSFFGVQRKGEVQMKDAVAVVKNDLNDDRLSECVIRALAVVIDNPTPSQTSILTQWARAFVAMESMSLDPLLNNFKSKNLREKEFIIDTDVVLHCLTTQARYSEDYRQMIAKLKDLRCTMYVVPEVVTEVQKHIDAAINRYKFLGKQLIGYPDEMLYEKICNVFIDDYVHIEREAKEYTPFLSYIEEISDPEYPALLRKNLIKAFNESALQNTLQVDTNDPLFQQLETEVYKLTIQTPKAQGRSAEDNQAISHLDTIMYMAASKNNASLDVSEMLSGKTYILTDSTRALRAASNLGWEKRDVVCHPKALMALLMEMGDVKSQETIINLFDNPFLAYVADIVWDEIQPLLDQGAYIKYKGFEKLRADVDKQFDKLMTIDMPEEERHSAFREYEVYLPDMIEAGEKAQEDLQTEIDKMKKEITGLRKSLAEARMVKAKPGKGQKNTSSRKKKKKRK